ncbi:hypothetical protein cyc_04095 [Cyclospora cayetanensis]|uniref:Uncharacterized protein n=1 Tax=Cyclospora cayetanensis TaxID=88456 RepID=A0A1D3D4V7_9EIME|nr:hypothetical protein cyc_04095 [Cyclospora cayetanensis]
MTLNTWLVAWLTLARTTAALAPLESRKRVQYVDKHLGESTFPSSDSGSSSHSSRYDSDLEPLGVYAGDEGYSSAVQLATSDDAKVLRTLSFSVFENSEGGLKCEKDFIRIKSAEWKSAHTACSSVWSCKSALASACNDKHTCRFLPVSESEVSGDSSGAAYVRCGYVCPTSSNPMRVLKGEYECYELTGSEGQLLGSTAAGVLTAYSDITWDSMLETNAAPADTRLAASGGPESYYTTRVLLSENFKLHVDSVDSTLQAALSKDGQAFSSSAMKTFMSISNNSYISNAWFTSKGSVAILITPQKSENPSTLLNAGKAKTGTWRETDGTNVTRGVDVACGGLDAFAYTTGFTCRASSARGGKIEGKGGRKVDVCGWRLGFLAQSRNTQYKAAVYCSNKDSSACEGLTELNSQLEKDRPAAVMIEGISCHPKGTAFALLFSDGTVLAFGDPLQGGKMTDEAENGLSHFDVTRRQRVKKILATTGAFTVLLQNGSMYSWGDTTVGGQLPSPKPTDIMSIVRPTELPRRLRLSLRNGGEADVMFGTEYPVPRPLRYGMRELQQLAASSMRRTPYWPFSHAGGSELLYLPACPQVAADVGFAAMTGAGDLYTWGKNLSIPSRVGSEGFKNHKLDSELAVWGSSASTLPVCTEGFSGSNSVSFKAVKPQLTTGVKMVRFNERAAVAARQRGETEDSPGLWELVAWGDLEAGATLPKGIASAVRNGVKSLHATSGAFLVVNADNMVEVWGDSASGGGDFPAELTHERPVASIAELNRAFVLIYLSGEVLVYGHAGPTMYSGVDKASLTGGKVVELTDGLSIVRGIGGGDIFVGAIGTPFVLEAAHANGALYMRLRMADLARSRVQSEPVA